MLYAHRYTCIIVTQRTGIVVLNAYSKSIRDINIL